MTPMETNGLSRRVADDVWIVDTLHRDEPGVIGCYLLAGSDGLGLVDVGPGATGERVAEGVREAGFDPRDLRHLVLTHVHLDHAGATGMLAQIAPKARVYVHPLGARHLIDPSKLLASAARIYGDQMDALWGTMIPVPEERVTVVADGEVMRVGDRVLTALYTPGHAVHHIAYHDDEHAALFAGDVAGVRLEGVDYVRPPTPPPDLNLEDWSASIRKMRNLRDDMLYLPHFGMARNVEAHLQQLEERLYTWSEFVLSRLRSGADAPAIASALAAQTDPELHVATPAEDAVARRRYEYATNYLMTVRGYQRYFGKHHPEWLET